MRVAITLDIPSEKVDEVLKAVKAVIEGQAEPAKPPKKPKKEKPAPELDPEGYEENPDLDEEEELEEPETDDEDAEDEEAPAVTLEDVITTIKEFIGKNKKGERDQVLKTLQKKWGVKNVSKLDASDYAAVIKEFSK